MLSCILRAREEHNVAVGRYVIMPDHIHLFVAMPAVNYVVRVDSLPRTGRQVSSSSDSVLRSLIGKKASLIMSCGAPRATRRNGITFA